MDHETAPAMTSVRSTVLRSPPRGLGASTRGAVLVEYAFLLVAVAIPTVMGMTAGGVAMLKEYQASRSKIIQNTP